jgi:nicotinate-nucleotide adenylyltransferase
MRIALFGGTFDPLHRGHLAIAAAAAAADQLALDTILFAPTGRQPLKLTGPTASFADRLAMTTLACAIDPRFSASDLDAPRPDHAPNYTVDVLAALTLLHPEATLFNLVGLDSFLTLPQWRDPQRLLTLAEWIVVSRPGFALDAQSALTLTEAQRSRVHLLDGIHEDVSATELRHLLEQGDPCLDLIPAPVSAYIATHHLYR